MKITIAYIVLLLLMLLTMTYFVYIPSNNNNACTPTISVQLTATKLAEPFITPER